VQRPRPPPPHWQLSDYRDSGTPYRPWPNVQQHVLVLRVHPVDRDGSAVRNEDAVKMLRQRGFARSL
jgi:hypothetical protein